MAKEKIRVLRIINRFNLGGPTYNAAYLTKYLGEGFETLLVGGSKDEHEASSQYILENLEIKPRVISSMMRYIGTGDWTAYQELVRIIDEYKPHVVHTHASKAGTLGRLAAIRKNVPVIVHTFHGHVFHSYFGSLKTNFYKAIERYLAKRSTAIIAISNQQKHELSIEHGICKSDKIKVIPLGFDLSRFRERRAEKRVDFRAKYGLHENEIAVGIVGRLVPIKNHEFFLKVAQTAFQKNSKLRFFIVGDGESRDHLEAYASGLGLTFTQNEAPNEKSPLCFTSWIKEVDWVYAGCDIVCLTSLNEGTPVSLIEAQSAGKPIVSTQVGGIHDIVDVNRSAYLTTTDDTDQFTEYVLQLAEDEMLRKDFGQSGENCVAQRFDYARLCADVAALYEKLLEEKNET